MRRSWLATSPDDARLGAPLELPWHWIHLPFIQLVRFGFAVHHIQDIKAGLQGYQTQCGRAGRPWLAREA